jgi:hypothetical protein
MEPEFPGVDGDALYDQAATETIEMGNNLADSNPEADIQDVADGLLAGAIQYWLFSRQPCGDPNCPDCAEISTAELRLKALLEMVQESATTSDYFHSPTDANAGNA